MFSSSRFFRVENKIEKERQAKAREEALKRFRELNQKEVLEDEAQAKYLHEMTKTQSKEELRMSRADATRFNQNKSMNATGWRAFGVAKPLFALSLSFVGYALWFQAGMWRREEDALVCVNCARQKEIAEEIYFGKAPKKSPENEKFGRMMP
jgi:hypothetical protein